MPKPEIDSVRLDVLLKEHSITCSQIHQMVNYSDKMVSISVGGIGLAFLYGVKESSAIAVATLPFIALGLMSYFCSVFYSIAVLGGYRKYLEERINEHTNEATICWEKVTSKLLHNGLPAIGLVLILGFLYLTLCAVAWNSTDDIVDPAIARLIKSVYLGGAIFLGAAAASLRNAHSRSYKASKANAG